MEAELDLLDNILKEKLRATKMRLSSQRVFDQVRQECNEARKV